MPKKAKPDTLQPRAGSYEKRVCAILDEGFRRGTQERVHFAQPEEKAAVRKLAARGYAVILEDKRGGDMWARYSVNGAAARGAALAPVDLSFQPTPDPEHFRKLIAKDVAKEVAKQLKRTRAKPGYTDCACRDCFEIAIGVPGRALCHGCVSASCEANNGECQRPDAYGG